ncbi:MAG: hypothetical protein L3J84_10125 [Gammaproteobacteria bacterium]|nr:hypothetical protein [Gammaproteobacteria bacterium]
MSDQKYLLNQLLDQMANYLLTGREIEFSECVLEWYRKEYSCEQTPKPEPTDLKRLAVKASIMERLVEVLNAAPRSGHEAAPAWCKEVGAVAQPIKLQSDRLLEDEELCEAFNKRNLQVVKNFMYFI